MEKNLFKFTRERRKAIDRLDLDSLNIEFDRSGDNGVRNNFRNWRERRKGKGE